MSPRRVVAIVRKDVRDAFRDGRILIVLALPVALAAFYNATVTDEEERPETTVAIVDPAGSGIGEALRTAARSGADVTLARAGSAAAARRLVAAGDAEFAVVARPPARGAQAPARAEVLLPADATPTTQAVVALVRDAVATAAGRPPASRVDVTRLPLSAEDRTPADVLDQSMILVVICVVMLLGFVALIVVPMQTAEEIGSGTFGALRLAATGPEILAAKAVSGMLYALGGTALILAITGVAAHDPLRLYGGALALAISLVGFGLLLGFLSGNANQINTYGGFIILPVIAIASAVLIVERGVGALVLDVLPVSQGTRLLFDGVSPQEPFATGVLAWLVLAGWSLAGFALLTRIAIRRDA